MLIGMITPGNNTVFRSGKIGSVSGICILSFSSSFSSPMMGRKSAESSPMFCNNTASDLFYPFIRPLLFYGYKFLYE